MPLGSVSERLRERCDKQVRGDRSDRGGASKANDQMHRESCRDAGEKGCERTHDDGKECDSAQAEDAFERHTEPGGLERSPERGLVQDSTDRVPLTPEAFEAVPQDRAPLIVEGFEQDPLLEL